MSDQAEPHPPPSCMQCGNPLDANTTVWPLNDDGKRRHIDTGHPCGHVQLDTVLEADGDTIGQLEAAQAAATIRLVDAIVGRRARTNMLALAERVEHYNGVDDCPLCGSVAHEDSCPLRHRTEEIPDGSSGTT